MPQLNSGINGGQASISDIYVSAPFSERAGKVKAYFDMGGSFLSDISFVSIDSFGYRVFRGDLDMDGINEVFVGDPDANCGKYIANGRVTVFRLDTIASRFEKIFELCGPRVNSARFGEGIAVGGDSNGDGFREFAVSGTSLDDTSNFLVIYNGKSGRMFSTRNSGTLGYVNSSSVTSGFDYNLDGINDYVLSNDIRGDLIIYSGALSQTFAELTTIGLGTQGRASSAGTLFPDVNGDSIPEIAHSVSYSSETRFTRSGASPCTEAVQYDQMIYAGTPTDPDVHTFLASLPYDDSGSSNGGYMKLIGVRLTSSECSFEVLAGDYRELAGVNQGRLGTSISAREDVDGDGVDDYLVGEPDWDNGPALDAGRVLVVSGIDGSLIHEVKGELAGGHFGEGASLVGDIDGDGKSEFVVSSPLGTIAGTIDTGILQVFKGGESDLGGSNPTVLFSYENVPMERYAGAMATGGEQYDGLRFGVSNLAANQNEVAGKLKVLNTSNQLLATTYSAMVGTYYGKDSAGVADYTVLGSAGRYKRMAVSEPRARESFHRDSFSYGKVWIYARVNNLVTTVSTDAYQLNQIITSSNPGTDYGWSIAELAIAGDVEDTGLIIGEPGYLGDMGQVHIFDGRVDPLVHQCTITPNLNEGDGSRFGEVVGAMLDITGDGFEEIMISAPYWDGPGTDTGRVYVYAGAASGCGSSILTLDGPQSGGKFGFSTASIDIDKDGFADVIVGAPYVDGPGTKRGAVYVYSGNPANLGDLLLTNYGYDDNSEFGYAVAGFENTAGNNGFAASAPSAPGAIGSNLENVGRVYKFEFP